MRSILLFTALVIFMSSCISKKEYDDLKEKLAFYENEVGEADEVSNELRELQEANQEKDLQLAETLQDLEQLTATNLSLNRSYQELLEKYDRYENQNKEIRTTTAYEKLSLQEQLAAQQLELEDRQRNVANLEYQVYQKDTRLSTVEYDYLNAKGDIQDRDRRIRELESLLNVKEEKMAQVKDRLSEVLYNISSKDISVEEKNGRLNLSLSQDLLFKTGSKSVDYKGKKVLEKVANILNQNPDIDILVEGHTDSKGSASSNWDLSVDRAAAVVKVLTSYKVDPKRITAAGRSFFVPIASNQTEAGRAKNRRTEIILSPKFDELYNLLNTSNNR
ncbi:MAG: OmpA family protein [Saprospiraceae bacterium]|nr:OmpA family protein [Saprospiraceae bacterium]